MKPLAKKPGFTLVELIVAIGIMSVVTTICVTVFFKVGSLWRDTDLLLESHHVVNEQLDTVRRDLAELVSPRLTGRSFVDVDQLVLDEDLWGKVSRDSVAFPVHLTDPSGKQSQMLTIRYYIEPNSHTLLRAVQTPGSESSPATTAILTNVVHFQVDFLTDGGQWLPAWNREGTPAAVRFSMTLMLPNRPHEQFSRTAVFPVHVQ